MTSFCNVNLRLLLEDNLELEVEKKVAAIKLSFIVIFILNVSQQLAIVIKFQM